MLLNKMLTVILRLSHSIVQFYLVTENPNDAGQIYGGHSNDFVVHLSGIQYSFA